MSNEMKKKKYNYSKNLLTENILEIKKLKLLNYV